ncbi:MAG: hypothetical protein AB8F95_17590 [Bacteroidia bacterium]
MIKSSKNIITAFVKPVEFFYKILYPLDRDLRREMAKTLREPKTRVRELNRIRVNNILSTLWANTGALFGLIITYVTVLFALVTGLAPIFLGNMPDPIDNWALQNGLFTTLLILISTYILVIITFPSIVKNILYYLPADQYAEVSLSNLNESEILSFTSLKMWEICNLLVKSVTIDQNLRDLIKEEEGKSEINLKDFRAKKGELVKIINDLNEAIHNFDKKYHKYYFNALELRDQATTKLGIHEREFCHHILKFSPAILNSRISTLKLSANTLGYIINQEDFATPMYTSVFFNHMNEVIRIVDDVKNSGMRSLLQVICHPSTHGYLIGLSSITSTSRSLKLFLRGLASIAKDYKEKYEFESARIECQDRIETLLHRSKAHYGMDLLIAVENLYKKNFKINSLDGNKCEIPEILYHLKYGIRGNVDNSPTKFMGRNFEEVMTEKVDLLVGMRENLLQFYTKDTDSIRQNFELHLDELIKGKGKKYICLFGYSRVVRNVLKYYKKQISDSEIAIFVFKQEKNHMIDTRILRYELNDDKPSKNIRGTFTATDHFFFSLPTKDDKLIFLCGAEAFCKKPKLLFHTNTYQARIETLLNRFEDSEKKPNPEIWILAENYKVFDSLPPKGGFFDKELLADHYDEVDLYNFDDFASDVYLISTDFEDGRNVTDNLIE